MGNLKAQVSGKTVYVAGPMAGRGSLNRDAFNAAERKLRDLGARTVYNPIRLAAFALAFVVVLVVSYRKSHGEEGR